MIIDILYWIFVILALLCTLANLFLSFYLNKDVVANNHKYDKWYEFHNITYILVWVFIIICALLLLVKNFI